jgi:hypothetical protein
MKTKASVTPLTIAQRFIFVIMGLAFIAAGIYMYADMFIFGKGVSRTEGTIIDVKEEYTEVTHLNGKRDYNLSYRPIVKFTVGAKQYKFLSKTSSSFYKVNQRVKVNYDPKDPSNSARLAGWQELLWPGVGIMCGAIAILLGKLAPSKRKSAASNPTPSP